MNTYVTVVNDRAVVRHDDGTLDHPADAAACEACATCATSQGW